VPWAAKGELLRRRRWRFYETAAGRRPVREFLDGLSGDDLADVLAAMRDVARNGMAVARHLRGDIYEVRAEGSQQTFRVLFSAEGRSGQVLLALEGFSKKTRRTPPALRELAERRMADWRRRGQEAR
jgi:phage-related protein